MSIAYSNINLNFIRISANVIVSNANITPTGTLKLERTGTQFKIYWNGTLIQTVTNISSTNGYGFFTYINRKGLFKNLKIKPL